MGRIIIILVALFSTVVFLLAACVGSSASDIPEQPVPAASDTGDIPEPPVPESNDPEDIPEPTVTETIEFSDFYPAKVTRVVDGDTIEVLLDGVTEKVRLIGIDTPESVHPDNSKNVPYGKIATAFTKEKLDGKDVELEFDVEERDQYGRLLAYVYLDGVMFNKTLLDEGHATVTTYPPNVKYVDIFTEAQTAARDAEKGLWDIRESAEQNESQTDKNDAKYIGTVSSYKFHTMGCEWGQKIAAHNAQYFTSREDATNAGFIPCKVCNP